MTNQEAYDKATRGLLFQGEQAVEEGICTFITKGGLRCALGFLLPENITAKAANSTNEAFVFLNRELYDSDFMDSLRNVHNLHNPDEWPALLRQLAVDYKLSTRVLDETLTELNELKAVLNANERSGDPTIAECVLC